ncbi:MAG: glycine cleavage system aminomethyltransferase GcvT [Cytophagales bacterium]|nr:MAG: glycine cleavage system aminomethyltransferase GcvT [Cytophagales bacterium]
MPVKKIPLNHLHEQLGAKMVPFAGFLMPVRYSSDIEEHQTVRNGVGVFDVSHMGEFRLRGKQALDLIQLVSSNDASVLQSGKIQYSCMPNGQGGIVDDLLIYKVDEEEYFLVVNAGNIEKDWNWIAKHNQFDVEMTNESSQWCLFAVQGPEAINVLQSLTTKDLKEIKYYSFIISDFAGVPNIIISATGYTGAGGFEIYVPKEFAEAVWNKIFEAGKAFNIKPIGLGARDTLRLEMGYCLYGNDIDDKTSALEAGLGWITKLNKKCIDYEFLVHQKEQGVSRKLVGFQMIDKGIPRSHYEIANAEQKVIGNVTSGTQSPSLGYGIGMGYLQVEYAKLDSEIYINIRGRYLKAKVVKLPFLKS